MFHKAKTHFPNNLIKVKYSLYLLTKNWGKASSKLNDNNSQINNVKKC